ncbi:MAG: hypothetical protein Q8O99_05545 [bacterium]|nr:hypothetical protein [bacterium]
MISDHQKVQTKKVMAAIQEAVVYIKKRPTRALGVMQKLFPTYQALDKTLYEYL